ncbi:hypothetical protein ABKN59_010937, partial [Abortiporus biennis]
GKSSDFQTR